VIGAGSQFQSWTRCNGLFVFKKRANHGGHRGSQRIKRSVLVEVEYQYVDVYCRNIAITLVECAKAVAGREKIRMRPYSTVTDLARFLG
jgi:hypothetical protein